VRPAPGGPERDLRVKAAAPMPQLPLRQLPPLSYRRRAKIKKVFDFCGVLVPQKTKISNS
jgi:hypothetical protein